MFKLLKREVRQTIRSHKKLVDGITLLAAGIALWAILAALVRMPYLIPGPLAVMRELAGNSRAFLSAGCTTAGESLSGLLVSVAAGVVMATWIYLDRRRGPFLLQIAVVLKVIPIVALAPLLAVCLGGGFGTKVLMAALVSFFPILQNTYDGLMSVPEDVKLFNLVRGVSRMQELRLVRGWYAVPHFASSLKTAAPLAVVGAAVAEFVLPTSGLGQSLVSRIQNTDTDYVFAIVICMSFIGIALYGATALVESFLLKLSHFERVEAENG
jgi:ABC-type nitrate/sulfonate/bicarbonate transport system permease component